MDMDTASPTLSPASSILVNFEEMAEDECENRFAGK